LPGVPRPAPIRGSLLRCGQRQRVRTARPPDLQAPPWRPRGRPPAAVAATASCGDRFTCSVKGKPCPKSDVPYRARVGQTAVTAALAAEAATLQVVVSGLTETDLSLASPCPPWTIGDLLCHVLIGADRISQALGQPADVTGPSITTVQYYQPDTRFSAATNADRIETARALAARLGDAARLRLS
jgi:hypothetical protein